MSGRPLERYEARCEVDEILFDNAAAVEHHGMLFLNAIDAN